MMMVDDLYIFSQWLHFNYKVKEKKSNKENKRESIMVLVDDYDADDDDDVRLKILQFRIENLLDVI